MTFEFDDLQLRQVLGNFPTGVVVITGIDENELPYGVTIGSFTSISLDPPLVGFFSGNGSRTWSAISAKGVFSVNVLASSQAELCWRFAQDADDRFDGIDWKKSANGSPQIPGAVAYFDCAVETSSQYGDHMLVVGRVQGFWVQETPVDGMVFFRGAVCGTSPTSN